MAFSVNELSTARYSTIITDELSSFPVPDSVTLTLYNNADKSVINARNGQDVLNANNVTYNSSTGQLVWSVQPLDNPIINDGLERELHIAQFKVVWASGTKVMYHKVSIYVLNLSKVA